MSTCQGDDDEREEDKREVLTHPLSSPPNTATQLPSETCLLTALVSYISVMSTDLPYAADAQVSLSYDKLEVHVLLIPFICSTQHSASTQVLRLQYQKELAQLPVTVQTTFNYAQGLVKSPVWKSQMRKRDRSIWQRPGKETRGVEFQIPSRLCWCCSLQPLVQLADLACQLRYVALVTLNVGFDIVDDNVEVGLDVHG